MAENSDSLQGEVERPDNSDQPNHEVTITRDLFSGPIPPPAILQGYGDIIPDAPERILKMAELEQEHRHGLDKRKITLDENLTDAVVKHQNWGQIFGFILGLSAIGLAGYMVHSGHPGYGITTTILAFTTLALSFVSKRNSEKKSEDTSD